MNIFEAIILGLIQGLTEFLPVSSSGHLEIAQRLFGVGQDVSLQFTVLLHGATVLSTITVFFKEIVQLFKGFFKFRMNDETIFVINILISMLPILFVGLFLKDEVEGLFSGNLIVVGIMLFVTAVLLMIASYTKPKGRKITPTRAFIIGLAQAVAVIPGLSRSGATITTGMMLGIDRKDVSKFSFLMVLIPVIGMNLLELIGANSLGASIGIWPLFAGFAAAYLSGTFACRWMIRLVSKGKLQWFALYCVAAGIFAICIQLFL